MDLNIFVNFFLVKLKACATFNFLNAENRMVASALIPPLHITYNENDILGTSIRKFKEGF